MSRMMNGCVGVFFALIFGAVGVALSLYGWRIVQNASMSKNWPTTQGEITASSVDESHDDDGTSYGANVQYTYVADDQRYSSSTVSFGQYSSSNRNHAQEIVDRYPVGKLVIVSYDPNNPATAVLEPGRTTSSYFLFIMGVVFLCVPVFMVLGSLRTLLLGR